MSRRRIPVTYLLFSFAASATCTTAGAGGSMSPAPPAASLFLGNSLTLRPPDDTIRWSSDWGMAASDSVNDYAHLLSAMFAGAQHRVINLGILETSPRTFAATDLDSILTVAPTVVIVEDGDNVNEATDVPAFAAGEGALLGYIRSRTNATIICTTTWFGKASIDAAIRDVCAAAGGSLVDLSPIAADPRNRAAAERTFVNAGVAAHPGDRGMAMIAAALDAAILKATRS